MSAQLSGVDGLQLLLLITLYSNEERAFPIHE